MKRKKAPIKRKRTGPIIRGKEESVQREARNYLALGATIAQLCDLLNIDKQTYLNWKNTIPEFKRATDEGMDLADALVENSLFKTATGYTVKDTKFFSHEGMIISQEYEKRVLPNTTAAIFWLKNRQPGKWKDVHEMHQKHSGEINVRHTQELDIQTLSKEEQDILFQLNLKQLVAADNTNAQTN